MSHAQAGSIKRIVSSSTIGTPGSGVPFGLKCSVVKISSATLAPGTKGRLSVGCSPAGLHPTDRRALLDTKPVLIRCHRDDGKDAPEARPNMNFVIGRGLSTV